MFAQYPAIRQHLRWASSAVLLMLSACGGDSASMPPAAPAAAAAPPSGTTGTATAQPLAATFESIQANIFTPICAGCHSGPNAAENLALDAAHSYADLINIPSTEEPSVVRVKPGEPMQSYLVLHIQKEGDGASATDLSFIMQWITDGALPAMSSMAMQEKFAVAAVEPDTGAELSAPPPRVIVGFTRELDVNSVNGTTVRLERVADDTGPLTATTIIPAKLSIPAGNARALVVTPSSALAPGNYQVVLDMNPGAEVGSIDGASLAAPARSVQGERVVTQFSVAQPTSNVSNAIRTDN